MLHARDGIGHRLRLFAPDARDFLEHALERGLAETIFLRKIGAGKEGLAPGREEHGERPAALRAHGLGRGLVELVDIGAFFAIDLHIDEQRIHQRRGFGIREAFVVHHMAPVARGIADREQDRFVLCLGGRERFRPPGAPIDRIVGVEQKVGACFLGELIVAHVRLSDMALGRYVPGWPIAACGRRP